MWPELLHSMVAVLAFLITASTNYHKFRGLKQHKFIISQFLCIRSPAYILWILCSGSHRIKSRCQPGLLNFRLSWRRSASILPWMIAEFISLDCIAEVPISCCFQLLTPSGSDHMDFPWTSHTANLFTKRNNSLLRAQLIRSSPPSIIFF